MLVIPDHGAFIGWSTGPRSCPGKKFSQAEFVAVMATLLKDWYIEPLSSQEESNEAARKRLLGVINDIFYNMTPKMRNPENAAVAFVKR